MSLEDWFLENKRTFPWRETPTPYRVWVSEVMLQQTRASVVIAYFEKWMDQFPTVRSLAEAPLDQVIKLWEGLGYYSRARNLHTAAQIIVRDHGGEIPSSPQELSALPGLGPYTVGAILSFGFRKRAAAIDGNVARVVARFAWIDEEISKASAKKKLADITESLLSRQVPWVSMEALIELGATVCTPTPTCGVCPLQRNCVAFSRNMPTVLPLKAAAPKISKISRGVAVIESCGHVLVRKNGEDQVMGDLWEFPYFEDMISPLAVKKQVTYLLGKPPNIEGKLEAIQHSFTRYVATLYPYKFSLCQMVSVEGFCWIPVMQLQNLPFSSGHRKLVKQLYMSLSH